MEIKFTVISGEAIITSPQTLEGESNKLLALFNQVINLAITLPDGIYTHQYA